MGTIMDLAKGAQHDYVDNKFFSVQEVYVKYFNFEQRHRIMDIDKGKVSEPRFSWHDSNAGASLRKHDSRGGQSERNKASAVRHAAHAHKVQR